MPRKNYLPTQQEIKEACIEIRKGWDEEEHIARMTGLTKYDIRNRHWSPPIMPIPPGMEPELVSDIDVNYA